jgi:hypothetical protein
MIEQYDQINERQIKDYIENSKALETSEENFQATDENLVLHLMQSKCLNDNPFLTQSVTFLPVIAKPIQDF